MTQRNKRKWFLIRFELKSSHVMISHVVSHATRNGTNYESIWQSEQFILSNTMCFTSLRKINFIGHQYNWTNHIRHKWNRRSGSDCVFHLWQKSFNQAFTGFDQLDFLHICWKQWDLLNEQFGSLNRTVMSPVLRHMRGSSFDSLILSIDQKSKPTFVFEIGITFFT